MYILIAISCVYTCIYIKHTYIYTCTYTINISHIHIYTHTYDNIYTPIYTHRVKYIYTQIYIVFLYINKTHTHIPTIHTHTLIYTYIYTNIHVYTLIYVTHTYFSPHAVGNLPLPRVGHQGWELIPFKHPQSLGREILFPAEKSRLWKGGLTSVPLQSYS